MFIFSFLGAEDIAQRADQFDVLAAPPAFNP